MCFRVITILPGRVLERSQKLGEFKQTWIASKRLLSGVHSRVSTHRSTPNRASTSRLFGSIAKAGLTMEEMDQSIVDLVRQIHDNPAKAVFYVAGGGAQVGHPSLDLFNRKLSAA